MTADALLDLCLFEIAERLRRRDVSPVEVTEAALVRIEALDGLLRAFVTVMADEATAAARRAEREIMAGRYRGPLHGVPIGVKDLCETAGVRTTAGSRFFMDWIPDRDATVVRKLRDAGATVLGKLNLHEFAFGATGVNPHTGTARNPWDDQRIAGGSSSGSGVAVAARECFAALGTDTGGSIRMPAALCGVVGLKPTHGRVSLNGVVPLAPSLDHAGPITRCVRDAAFVLQAIAGHDPDDPWSVDVPVGDFSAQLDAGVRSLRIAVPGAYVFDGCDPEITAAVEQAIGTLTSLGARRVEADAGDLSNWWSANMTILLCEAAAYHRQRYEASPLAFGDDVRSHLAAGMEILALEYVAAAQLRDTLRHGGAGERLFASADVVMMPATPLAAPRIDDVVGDDAAAFLTHNTAPFDVSGHPVITVPCGLTAAGLPMGLQMVGRHWDEATLLRAAAAYERGRGPLLTPSL